MEHQPIIEEVPREKQCRCCGSAYESIWTISVETMSGFTKGDVKLCESCAAWLQNTNPSDIRVSFWQMGRRIDVEKIEVDN